MTTINTSIATMFNLIGVKVKVKHFCTSQRSLENHNCEPYIGKVGKIVGIRDAFLEEGGKFEVKFEGAERNWFFYGDLLKIVDETITIRKDLTSLTPELQEQLKRVDVKIKPFNSASRRVEVGSMQKHVGSVGKITGFFKESTKTCFAVFCWNWEGDLLEVKTEGLKRVLKGLAPKAPPTAETSAVVVEGFVVGSRVELVNIHDFVHGGEYDTYSTSNVVGNKGVVTGGGISGEAGWIRVKWDNGTYNSYRAGNLKVLREVVEKPVEEGIQVGDYVRGTIDNGYGLTNHHAIMRVEGVSGNYVDVVMVVSKNGYVSKNTFTKLDIKGFVKITEADKAEFKFDPEPKVVDESIKVGDYIRGNSEGNHYGMTNKNAIMKVTKIAGNLIDVVIVAEKANRYIGNPFSTVRVEKFHKVTEADKAEFGFTPEEERVAVAQVVKQEPFKVGDIVTGIPDNGYSITTNKAIMKVLSLYGGNMKVELLAHSDPDWQHRVGNTYHVEQGDFKKFKEGVDFSALTK